MSASISKFILKIFGWKVTGYYPKEIKKKILAAAPHTSNWDFPLGLLVRNVIEDNVKYIGKSSLFKPPFGWIFSKLGGVPVDRSKSNNFVDAVVDEYRIRESFAVLFAPEGKRKRVERFKSGYYHIARLAGIPIVPCVLDYAKKEFRFLPVYWPTDNVEQDLIAIENLFRGIKGYHPKQSFHYLEGNS